MHRSEAGESRELDEDIPEVILYGFNNDFSDYSDSISDNSYSVEWIGDDANNSEDENRALVMKGYDFDPNGSSELTVFLFSPRKAIETNELVKAAEIQANIHPVQVDVLGIMLPMLGVMHMVAF